MARMTTAALCGTLMLGAAHAHTQDQEGDFTQECVALFEFVEATDDLSLDDEPELVRLIERNSSRACARELRALRAEFAETDVAETRTRTQARQRTQRAAEVATETETVRQRVQLEEVVVVTGDVDVAVPAPTVEVDQRPATVRVEPAAPRVAVRTGRPEIVVREQPATVTIGMPTITIEQEAPEIVITLPPHEVDVTNEAPRVVVNQPDPVVRVEMPDPRIDLDLRAVAAGDAAEGDGVRTRFRRQGSPAVARDGLRVVDAGADAVVYVRDAEAELDLAETEQQARVTVEDAGEPRVRFERAEPRVRMDGEPEVRFEQTGEPRVRVVREGERSGRRETAAQQRFAGGEARTADRREGERTVRARVPQRAAGDALTVRDLRGREVIGRDGEELGEVSRVVRSNGQVYVIVETGGFLGVGEREAPLALSDLRVRGEQLVAPGLTEERVEALAREDISERLNIGGDERVRIRAED